MLGKAVIRSIDKEDWRENGDHVFWWISPADRAIDTINVWDAALARQGEAAGGTTFTVPAIPTEFAGFSSLTFDDRGHLTDLTVTVTAMSLSIDSAQDPGKALRFSAG